ncbi:MAG: hypothetical protein II989_03150 [Bacteroidales bacterium]|nr:hypothetical protein [Bacteroidales bacterium]
MKKLIALISLLFIFVSCDFLGDSNGTEQDLTGYGEFKLTEEAVFMTEEQTSLFASVENGMITMPLSASEEDIPSAGDVILCPITDKTPAGLLVKVVSVEKTGTGYVLSTEPAMLQDAFEELKVNSSFDISSFVENITDGDGNIIEAESVSSDIWSDFAGSPEDTTSAIPTKAAGNAELAVKFPVKTDWFSGYLFTEFNLNVDIDISKRQLNRFYVGLNKKTGISGDVGFETEAGFKAVLVEKSVSFRPFLIPGTPIVIRPSMYVEDTFEAKGKLETKLDLRFLCENHTYSIDFHGGRTSFDSKDEGTNENHLKFRYLNAEAELELAATCGCKFAIYDDEMLAFGVEASAKQNLHLQNEIMMENDGLLIENPVVDVTPSLEASAYCESFLFGIADVGEDGKISYDWDFGLPSYRISTLPQFFEIQTNKAGGTLTVSSEVEETCLLECSEEGFALFKVGEDEPLVHLSFSAGEKTKAVISDELTFNLPDPETGYEARPYAVADNRYYYGETDDRWVDLGLPSGILWAKYNVGATSPEEYGGYYAWGETEEKSSYTIENYKYYRKYYVDGELFIEGINIGSQISGTNYDVAHVKWGNGARMPSKGEVLELLKCCSNRVAYQNGIQGYNITGPNGNNIFLPCAGWYENDYFHHVNQGYYWTGYYYEDSSKGAFGLYFCEEEEGMIIDYDEGTTRHYGLSIRPVKDK